MYLNLERQNQLQVYRTVNGESVEPKALFTKDTLDNQAASKPQQMTGAIHVHPNGRFVYISNRASGTTMVDGKPVWEGGENTIGVYAIDQKTGEPCAYRTSTAAACTRARSRSTRFQRCWWRPIRMR